MFLITLQFHDIQMDIYVIFNFKRMNSLLMIQFHTNTSKLKTLYYYWYCFCLIP